jgi:hypothetical protein
MIFGFFSQNLKTQAVAVAFSMAWLGSEVEPGADRDDVQSRDRLAVFRGELYGCLTARGDALCEVADAVLCGRGRVQVLAELSLEPECRRGHGGVYDAVNAGRVDIGRLRRALAGVRLPGWPDGRIRLAADVSSWLRPDAVTSPERLFCVHRPRGGGEPQMVPGWPCSVLVALEPGRTSWALPLDAVRLGPADDATEVTAAQVREVITRLSAAGHWHPGDPPVLVAFDAGYDLARLAWLLAGLPVEVVGRLRSNRVLYFPPPPRPPGLAGRAARHGAPFRLARPASWPAAPVTGCHDTPHGTVGVSAWHRLHPKLVARSGWEGHDGDLPVIEGTVIQLRPDRQRPGGRSLPGGRPLDPMWLWSSAPQADPGHVTVLWQAYLRRFDIEHTFRFLKQVLGWTAPRLRDPAAADRWTWLILACYAQLWLARDLAADHRLPWQQPCKPGRLTPARVRQGFRCIHATMPPLASAPKPARPGPGRPPGTPNRHPATRHTVGKTAKRARTLQDTRNKTG